MYKVIPVLLVTLAVVSGCGAVFQHCLDNAWRNTDDAIACRLECRGKKGQEWDLCIDDCHRRNFWSFPHRAEEKRMREEKDKRLDQEREVKRQQELDELKALEDEVASKKGPGQL